MSEEDLQRQIAALEARVTALEAGPKVTPATPASASKPESIREFLNRLGPKTAVDKALGVAVWLEANGSASFTTADLISGFRDAKEPAPGNPSDLLYQNVRRGSTTPAKDKKDGSKAYIVTHTGEKFAMAGFKE